jgi:hypothetical protein
MHLYNKNQMMDVYFKPSKQLTSQGLDAASFGGSFTAGYFSDLFGVAAFTISANCDNCEVSNSSFSLIGVYSAIGTQWFCSRHISGTRELYDTER